MSAIRKYQLTVRKIPRWAFRVQGAFACGRQFLGVSGKRREDRRWDVEFQLRSGSRYCTLWEEGEVNRQVAIYPRMRLLDMVRLAVWWMRSKPVPERVR